MTTVPFKPTKQRTARLVTTKTRVPQFNGRLRTQSSQILLRSIRRHERLISLLRLTYRHNNRVRTRTISVRFNGPMTRQVNGRLRHIQQTRRRQIANANNIRMILLITFRRSMMKNIISTLRTRNETRVITFNNIIMRRIRSSFRTNIVMNLSRKLRFISLLTTFPKKKMNIIQHRRTSNIMTPMIQRTLLLRRKIISRLISQRRFSNNSTRLLRMFSSTQVNRTNMNTTSIQQRIRIRINRTTRVHLMSRQVIMQSMKILIITPIRVQVSSNQLRNINNQIGIIRHQNIIQTFRPMKRRTFITISITFSNLNVQIRRRFIKITSRTIRQIVKAMSTMTMTLTKLRTKSMIVPCM